MTKTKTPIEPLDLRDKLLIEARRLLTKEGLGSLTVRKLAERAECSTMVIYSRFGGKDGILDALYAQGFEALQQTLDKVSSKLKPCERVLEIARAYRTSALASPDSYGVMYGSATPGFIPSADAKRVAWATLQTLIEALANAADAGEISPGNPVHRARLVWVSMHGVVSLELTGYLLGTERPESLLDDAVRALLASFQTER
jgi:AcrR family transcriptional regulator